MPQNTFANKERTKEKVLMAFSSDEVSLAASPAGNRNPSEQLGSGVALAGGNERN